ncbi:MAG: hypothetical protein FK730_14515 [Asgard group archaeon]|nr:hypothetical protein [Asgard group archaeon]
MSDEAIETHNQMLSEKEMTYVLIQHLRKLGYIAVAELVLNSSLFDISRLVEKNISKVRIDVAAYKDDKITFIEVENGLWLTHPILYRELAHILFLAYPAEFKSPSDDEQILLAKRKGIGIISVTVNGSIKTILRPVEHQLSESQAKAIISLIEKRKKKLNY